ncbi:hypothetical protein IT396_01075 [Candidatus Nomurabacteria bacterium]|nr:hypothetical protein [Candidatus Nomurabacteria bacterium]
MSYGRIEKVSKGRYHAHYGGGLGVQAGSKGVTKWSKKDDELLLSTSTPTEKQFGEWVLKLKRPPSVVRTRHLYLWELKRKEREKRIAKLRAERARENQMGQ